MELRKCLSINRSWSSICLCSIVVDVPQSDVPAEDGKAPVIVPPKQTTLYVGKIASSINDDLIKQLLDACGSVKSWKRMEDPDSKALKPFGFCEYEEADGVVRALNLLQNLSVGGQVSYCAVLLLPLQCLHTTL